ncbi:MAG: insulinase family protein [Acutalibacteraceae bacterium]|jgi:Zn-dependent M16 (insulinase) family peptidase
MNKGERLHGFTVTDVRPVEEIGAVMTEMRHDRTGARLVWMNNREENKLFSVAFKTTPTDDTGVFHILEHSVLGGSKRYPVKEPFLEMLKSSMNTFLNAMTFPDKTMFPVSSRNDADFMNLTRVYLDAVFCPAIYDNPCIFEQEGWHVEWRNEADEPVYKGVVFNEMKGALSSVFTRMSDEMEKLLYPDTCYRFESGGDPAAIPDLTYERFIETHRRYYHPSNAYFYLDGPVDIDAVLGLIEDYLAGYDKRDDLPVIDYQTPIAPVECRREYEIAPEETPEGRTHLAIGKVVGDWSEREKLTALQAISEVLAGSNDAPLKRALLDTGLCRDVSLRVDDGVLQPLGVLEILNTDPENGQKLLDTVRRVVGEQVKNGLDREDLVAALNRMEFRMREGDEPKGLDRGIYMLSSWLYGGDPLLYIGCGDLFAGLRDKLESDYYEKLLAEWLLDESGRATLYMLPSHTFGERLRQAEEERLRRLRDGWSEQQAIEVRQRNRRLDDWQQAPNTPEDLATLPRLPLSQVSDQPLPLTTEVTTQNGLTVLRHPVSEKGIDALALYFSLADCTPDELFSLSVMGKLLGELPTAEKSGAVLQRHIKSLLGGLDVGVTAFAREGETATCQPMLAVSFRFLEHNADKALALVGEILTRTRFDRADLIRELLMQMDEDGKQYLIRNGHRVGMSRAQAGLSALSSVRELTDGFEGLSRLHDMAKRADEQGADWGESFRSLGERIFCRARMTVSATADTPPALGALLERLPEGTPAAAPALAWRLDAPAAQGVLIPAAISYAAAAFPIDIEHKAAWQVLASILSLEYLWNEIRVKGGAYGAGAVSRVAGEMAYYTFRDPSPEQSLQTFRRAADFVRQYAADRPDMDAFIISTIAKAEPLMPDHARGAAADAMYFSGITEQQRRENRRVMLSLKAEDLLAIVDQLENVRAKCVVGSQQALDRCESEGLTVASV